MTRARTAALLAGDVDLIDQVPPDRPRRGCSRDTARDGLPRSRALRLIYLAPDFRGRGRCPSSPTTTASRWPANPFNDVRVRRALSMAINRAALAERVMEGTARPTGQWLPAGTFGYNPDVQPPAFDPDGARRLLAEAGYPQGFRMTLHRPNDRYPNDARTAQAVAQMWTPHRRAHRGRGAALDELSARAARQEFSDAPGRLGQRDRRGDLRCWSTSSAPTTASGAPAQPTPRAIPTRSSTR